MPDSTSSRFQQFMKDNALFVVVMAMFAILAAVLITSRVIDEVNDEELQDALAPFYAPGDPLPLSSPGLVLRQEELGIDVPGGGRGVRVLYLSELEDGTSTVASGMIFYPEGSPPPEGRKVVAWAHPTAGMGDDCAPSRSDSPLSDMTWLGDMISRGWVVTATDYAGLGTPGIEQYLVGSVEARDLINSVRAAQQVEDAAAGTSYAVWGHSQGGHAALFAAHLAESYAPELQLAATAVAAPAAELTTLFNEQYQSEAGWVIGPEVLVSWPEAYPGLEIDSVVTAKGRDRYEELAQDCLVRAGEEALARNLLKEDFFQVNPMTVTSWYEAALNETVPPLPPEKPLLVIQGLDDKVVLPETTALFVQNSCRARSDITTLWLGGVNHMKAAEAGGPAAVYWLDDRFNARPTNPACSQIMPVNPANPPDPPAS